MNIQEVTESLSVKRKERLENAVFGEIKEMVKDNEHFTTIELNEKAIVEALEKQIPKKPEYYGDGYADGALVYDYAKCPVCGRDDFEYEINEWGCKYCPDCGQALDWSETEKGGVQG